MSKLTTLLQRVFVSVVFLLTGTRLGVARILPAPQSSQEPRSAKVFALTEAAWMELRAAGDGGNQDTKSEDENKKERSKSGDDKKEPPKSSDESKEQSKGRDCDKGGSKSGEDKKGDASKSDECGPGGGDGATGGSGG